ncbi:hypothetical protein FOXG_19591 [Fusarium oxysporum f. sp. lycopersici 4287]|uniref:PiggyBac transposable element-derived protein domain-containing protein n=1 Tax=Fusarium oxysporum f. sp. lycopersici (strain 4287 / CBS 123668 / FGSC 9935 / NRRL 34936) TaxID=426428 RepID=A0A0J9V5Q5_FUSO4|nr:hypothetical protein FOXG_19591 [Fusarium oxysporum f. sp. lycopersici 4287]KNB06171.1 hypothetical protein FOXG_19591 [Fusarium oxysporum f. sp. lycopersici 4287]
MAWSLLLITRNKTLCFRLSRTVDSFDSPPFTVAANDPTGAPNIPPEAGRGDDFEPFNLEYRDFQINPLPQQPLELFQLFVPISLVQSWVEYTEDWAFFCADNGIKDSWNTHLSDHSRLHAWEGISTATAYVWLGVLIYLGIHREISLKGHWEAPRLGDQRPLHSIIKFMPLRRFQLITRYFRTFDHTNLDLSDERDLPKTFQAAEEWSEHIQRVSIELYLPGTNLTVDECMVPFTGRSKETTLVKGKPTPVGFKIWVIAQQGYFLQWLWHVKASPVTAVTVKLEAPTPYGKKGKIRTEIPLSNTQSVVVNLLKRLITQTHHVFTDNLFSSPQLFRLLRQLGYGATGTARPNCGITTEIKQIKETGKLPNGKQLLLNRVYLIPTKDKQVFQIAWKDSSVVLFLSTMHGITPLNRTPKERKLPAERGTKAEAQRLKEVFNGDQARIIPIPSVAAQYNDEMNHVDRGDQIRSYTSYQHRFRRGPWQALLWSFLLDVALANSFILQKKTRQPHWKPYSTLQDWKEPIYNAIFNKYGTDSGIRKRCRTGKEEDSENLEARQIHLQRDINHIRRGKNSDCLACKGFRQGQP